MILDSSVNWTHLVLFVLPRFIQFKIWKCISIRNWAFYCKLTHVWRKWFRIPSTKMFAFVIFSVSRKLLQMLGNGFSIEYLESAKSLIMTIWNGCHLEHCVQNLPTIVYILPIETKYFLFQWSTLFRQKRITVTFE